MPDNKYVLSVDNGVDQVKIYRFNDKEQKMVQVDAIRCDLESAPRHFRFSRDGRFLYLMYELKNVIDVFTYETGDRAPVIEKIQTISTTSTKIRAILRQPARCVCPGMRSMFTAPMRERIR